jgi:hypothetical protein
VRFGRRLTAAVLALGWLSIAPAPAPAQAPEDKALGRPAIASSVEIYPNESCCAAGLATDGRDDTRWASDFVDPAWWQVDLGRPRQVDSVALTWHTAPAQRYVVETSLDGQSFAAAANVTLDLAEENAGLVVGGRYTQTTRFEPRSARYVRVTILERTQVVFRGQPRLLAVSLWTASVFGPADNGDSASGGGGFVAPGTATPTVPPDGGTVERRLMRPFPVVRLKGRITGSGAFIDLLSVTAPRNATIKVRCRGRSCPARVPTRPGGRRRISELHRQLAAGTVITVRVIRGWTYGKYTRFVIRRGRRPERRDSCLRGWTRRPVRCPAAE